MVLLYRSFGFLLIFYLLANFCLFTKDIICQETQTSKNDENGLIVKDILAKIVEEKEYSKKIKLIEELSILNDETIVPEINKLIANETNSVILLSINFTLAFQGEKQSFLFLTSEIISWEQKNIQNYETKLIKEQKEIKTFGEHYLYLLTGCKYPSGYVKSIEMLKKLQYKYIENIPDNYVNILSLWGENIASDDYKSIYKNKRKSIKDLLSLLEKTSHLNLTTNMSKIGYTDTMYLISLYREKALKELQKFVKKAKTERKSLVYIQYI